MFENLSRMIFILYKWKTSFYARCGSCKTFKDIFIVYFAFLRMIWVIFSIRGWVTFGFSLIFNWKEIKLNSQTFTSTGLFRNVFTNVPRRHTAPKTRHVKITFFHRKSALISINERPRWHDTSVQCTEKRLHAIIYSNLSLREHFMMLKHAIGASEKCNSARWKSQLLSTHKT